MSCNAESTSSRPSRGSDMPALGIISSRTWRRLRFWSLRARAVPVRLHAAQAQSNLNVERSFSCRASRSG
eukprot:1127161-Alexandrium_andersonii.AAC.1